LPSTLTVLDIADNGPGSLRDTIAAAQNSDTITFDASLAGQTITLTTGELQINKSLDIEGPGGSQPVAISGNNASRVIDIADGTAVTLAHLSIENGTADRGAGILHEGGSLTLSNVGMGPNISIGSAGGDAWGGGIYNAAGSLFITHCRFDDFNAVLPVAGHSGLGGAIYNAAGASLFVTDTDFSGNGAMNGVLGGSAVSTSTVAGGAIYDDGGNVTITNSTFEDNSAVCLESGRALGGAIYVGGGSFSLTNCVLQHNVAEDSSGGNFCVLQGGAIYQAGGDATIRNTVFLFNRCDGNEVVDVAQGGAIYQAAGTLSVTNSTFNLDEADGAVGQGGAIYIASGSLTIQNSAFVQDRAVRPVGQGGAIYIAGGSVWISKNTIFTDNFASTSDPDVFGFFTLC
jgi:hypothetical protein